MVSDQIIVGSYDKDCLADVLARNQTLKTFDEKFHLIQAHEEDKRAQSHLNTSSILTHKSTYQQAKKRSYLPQKSGKLVDQRDKRHPQPKASPASRSGCSGCGSQSQGWGTLLPRNENCPHWLTVHRKCKKTGHIKAVCSSCSSVTQIEDVPPESEVASILDDISTLFSMETDHVQSGHADTTFPHMEWVNDRFVTCGDTSSMISIIYPDSDNIPPIPHMVWSQGKFVPCPPKKPSWIYLNIEPLTESHSDVGLNLKLHWKNVRSGTVLCLADTLGISVDSLLPTQYEYQEESAGSEWHHHGEIWKRISLIQSAAVHMWQHMRTLSEKAQIDLKMIPPSGLGLGLGRVLQGAWCSLHQSPVLLVSLRCQPTLEGNYRVGFRHSGGETVPLWNRLVDDGVLKFIVPCWELSKLELVLGSCTGIALLQPEISTADSYFIVHNFVHKCQPDILLPLF